MHSRCESPKDDAPDNNGDDDSDHKRKSFLKHMLASRRLAQFRKHGHDKDAIKRKVVERQALTALEVEQHAEQAIQVWVGPMVSIRESLGRTDGFRLDDGDDDDGEHS